MHVLVQTTKEKSKIWLTSGHPSGEKQQDETGFQMCT